MAEIGTRISSSNRIYSDRTRTRPDGGRGGDKEMEKWVGGGMGGLGGRGGLRGLAFLLSQRGGGLGWLAFAALWGLCLSLPACNMEKTLALLLLLMHVTCADEVKKGKPMLS